MKLFLLSQNIIRGYDTYDSCIVAAPDEETARKIHPDQNLFYPGGFKERNEYFHTWVPREDIDKIQVTYLGEADNPDYLGVILSSFNAG